MTFEKRPRSLSAFSVDCEQVLTHWIFFTKAEGSFTHREYKKPYLKVWTALVHQKRKLELKNMIW